jgi:5-deoxy-glucuronate isomerase
MECAPGSVFAKFAGERWQTLRKETGRSCQKAQVFTNADDISPPVAFHSKGNFRLVRCAIQGMHGLPTDQFYTDSSSYQEARRERPDRRGRRTHARIGEKAEAESLLVVEVITPGGHWSSYPPHKHDRDAFPDEIFLEETYYYRLSPAQGFAFQRVYTDDRSIDETMAVEDGDVVMVPRGYHPVGAPHGYDLYYLNVMAGPRRKWAFANDPAHDWIVRG